MIKLKNILLEYHHENNPYVSWIKDKNNLLEVLNSNKYYKIYPEHMIYRGVKESLLDAFYETIRTDRKPRDSGRIQNYMFEIIRQQLRPELPKRNETLFAATIYGAARYYSENTYIVIPSKQCKIFESNVGDSMPILSALNDTYNMNIINQTLYSVNNIISQNNNKFVNLKKFRNIMSMDVPPNNMSFDFKKVRSEADELLNIAGDKIEKYEVDRIYMDLEKIEKYFTDIKQITDLSQLTDSPLGKEIYIGGDHVCMIKNEYFKKYFKYENDKWELI